MTTPNSPWETVAQNLLTQITLASKADAMLVQAHPWLHPFLSELLRKLAWTIRSTHSNHTHPALHEAATRALATEAGLYIVREIIVALRASQAHSSGSTHSQPKANPSPSQPTP